MNPLEEMLKEARELRKQNEVAKRKYEYVINDLKSQLKCDNPDAYVIQLLCEEISQQSLEKVITKLNFKIFDDKDNRSEISYGPSSTECVAIPKECENCENSCDDVKDCEPLPTA